MSTEAVRRGNRRRTSLSKASSSVALAAAAVLTCALPDAAHATTAAPADTETNKQTTTTVQTVVVSQQQSIRDFVQSFVRSILSGDQQRRLGGPNDELERRLRRFSGEPERNDPYALGYDPFEALALGYTKAPRKGPAPAPAAQSYFISTWAQGAHDHERRTNTFGGAPAGSTTTANTVVAGADVVKIGVAEQTDAFVIGGFGTWTTSHSASQQGVNTRSVTPGGGLYASYINGGFSSDVSVIITNTSSRFFAGAVPGAVDTDSLTMSFNTQYKFDLPSKWWVEPTVGYSATVSNNNVPNTVAGAVRRFQGGARVGTEFTYGTVRLEPTVTGLAYSDVDVETITANGVTFTGLSDKGYLWGKGIAKLNVVWTDKFSTSFEGEARGRADVFAYGARVMARYTW
jgi:hypothetical protein